MKRTFARSVWQLVALGLLIALLATSNAFAGHQTGSIPSYTGCLNPNGGTVYYLALGEQPQKQCTSGHPHIHLSGGDITAVAPGPGLTGGGSDGAVSLAVDSQQVQTRVSGDCAFPGGAITAIQENGAVSCNEGAAVIHGFIENGADVADHGAVIGSLPLPAGKYLIITKVNLKAAHPLAPGNDYMDAFCDLLAGGGYNIPGSDNDRAIVKGDTDVAAGSTLTMMVTHTFASPGSADVTCTDVADTLGIAQMEWSRLRVSAIKLGDLVVNP